MVSAFPGAIRFQESFRLELLACLCMVGHQDLQLVQFFFLLVVFKTK